jgi:hypothetical protein
MPSKAVVLVIIAFIAVVLICSSYSQSALAKAIAISGITCQTNLGLSLKVECCQSFRDGKIETLWCTQCDNTVPPSNCGPRYQANRGVANPTGVPTPAGNALPPPGSDTGPTIKVPPGVNALPNATNALPPGNSTGTPPPGSIIKVSPGTIGSATNPPPTNNNTGNPIAMTSSDNPPGCSKQIPIPLNCTLNPFNNSASNKAGTVGSAINPSNTIGTASIGNIIKVPLNHTNALPTGNNTGTPPLALKLSQPSLAGQQPQTQQTTGHHHKGSNTGASTSSGNSTKK